MPQSRTNSRSTTRVFSGYSFARDGCIAFSPPRNRDAWATIRGYVYQVELTLLRWLDLDETPIDTVSQVVKGEKNLEDIERLLEQVKHREENLSLKSASAVAFLATSYEHLQAKRQLGLRFGSTHGGDNTLLACANPLAVIQPDCPVRVAVQVLSDVFAFIMIRYRPVAFVAAPSVLPVSTRVLDAIAGEATLSLNVTPNVSARA